MKPKIYRTDKVAEVIKAIDEAPALAPRFIRHDVALTELSKHIKDLHVKKHYDAHQITKLLKDNGIKTTLREVRALVASPSKKDQTKP